jgi:GTP-binding protein
MSVPRVAIVGRPNVGKSSLFNWLARKLIAVVDGTAGTTRDRMRYLLHEEERYFEIIDTGGMGIVDDDNLSDDIENQIHCGMEEADLIVFVVDGKVGLTPLDREVGDRLRSIDKPKLLVVNKCDSEKLDDEIAEFFSLVNCDVVTTSVKGNRNRHELMDAILKNLPPAAENEGEEGSELDEAPEMKLAIVGRRNVGKSTFINALAEEERVIVSEVAGTTRDSIDLRFEVDGKKILAIDTPGVRKRKSLASNIEYYGLVRAQKSIRRADVVLMFFDSQETVSRVDKQLVEEIISNYKPCIFVLTKWDLAVEAGMTMDAWGNYIIKEFASIRHAPVAFITAKENRNVRKVVNLAQNIFKQSRERVGTGLLNRVLQGAILRNRPTVCRNKVPKIYYATQVASQPPTLVLKCNDPTLFTNSWKRYLLGVLQDALPFSEVPIKLYLRAKTDDEHRYPTEFSASDITDDDSIGDQPQSDLAEKSVENS